MSDPKSPYHEQYLDPNGPGDARPTALKIVKENGLIGALPNHTFLITGCSSGIGVETARALHSTGARIFVTARDVPRTESVLAGIIKEGRTSIIKMDLTSLTSVRDGAAEFLSQSEGKLNVLVCNAGIMAVQTHERTIDGFESQFGTNHLAHFLLFNLVKDALLKSSSQDFQSRVVCVSSSGHRNKGWTFGNYDFDPAKGEKYSPWGGYGQSKMANVYMANYIDRHYGPQGLHAYSLHPGGIETPLQKHVPGLVDKTQEKVRKILMSTEQGAATTVWAAVGKVWEGEGGVFLEQNREAGPYPDARMGGDTGGYAEDAFDVQREEKLWKDSLDMVGLAET